MATESKGTFKRDFLKKLEGEMQSKWQTEHVFEQDAPEDLDDPNVQPKFMATFPYPYMNGKLHLGHAFSASKAEFAVAFERMRGKRSLYPFGFHCTGMPIKAAADKLKNEMVSYGCPPVLPAAEVEGGAKGAKHSKVAAKTGNVKLQWDIMQQLNIPKEDIPKFAQPEFWMDYFPPIAQQDLTSLGFHIDWRRSFITTDKNPFYDALVRWQFNKLRAHDRIKFGKRHTIFSPLDAQPCLDHDRQSGEGVEPKEYTVVKLEVLEWPAGEAYDAVRKHRVFLGAATLRPETMYGQTNCWVGPEIEYGAYRVNDSDLIVCTKRSAMNMAYQGMTREEGKLECVGTFTGAQLIGLPVRAPKCPLYRVYVLPMFSVSAEKGTGIVTSVPSNSPADYVALKELKEKEPLRRKFGLSDEKILPFDPLPIISSATYGNLSAETVVKQLNIKSQNDTVALEKAKDLVYKDDFYSGLISVGPHAGKSVQEVKTVIRDEIIAEGDAFIYFEPEGLVMSRSGDECVVALTDQWYIDYGEPSWRQEAEKCLEKMNVFCDEVRHQFLSTLDWMKQWACSRSFGLGSRLPWDPTYLIESLSDSTIYMAYYSVSHILQEGSLDGSASPNGIRAEQMTDEVWEWIFGDSSDDGSGISASSGIPLEILKKMRREFRYWYPMSLRVSGKDLVPNHLTFSIYNHVAIFPERFWPLAMRANGHLLLNSQKMSKSTGNFMTVRDSIDEFGADATRLALADAGDGVEDANFLKDTANMSILRLYNQVEFYQEMLASSGKLRQDDGTASFHDRAFAAEMNRAIVLSEAAYIATNYREALKNGFFELQNARDRYRDATVVHGSEGMNWKLIQRFMQVQALLLKPITPHFSEYVWSVLMKSPTSIMDAPFPTADPVDENLLAATKYLQLVAHNLRTTLQAESRPKKGPAAKTETLPANSAELYVAVSYPKWQEDAIAVLKSLYDGEKFADDSAIVSSLKPIIKERANKKLIPFVMELKARVLAQGPQVLDRRLAFDEVAILESNMEYLRSSMGLLDISVAPVDPAKVEESDVDAERKRRQEASLPGEPSAYFYRQSE